MIPEPDASAPDNATLLLALLDVASSDLDDDEKEEALDSLLIEMEHAE